jgi:ABC-type transport system substrate-binding protein
MKTILTSVLALGALTSATLAAGPAPLTNEQMDSIRAGVSPWLTTFNPSGTQTTGCGGGNPNCTTIKDNPSLKN